MSISDEDFVRDGIFQISKCLTTKPFIITETMNTIITNKIRPLHVAKIPNPFTRFLQLF